MTTTIQQMPQGQMAVEDKTPGETEDFQIDWSARGLGTDTIASSSWSVDPPDLGTNSTAPSFTGTATTVWLSGGTAGVPYMVTNSVTTAGNRTLEESFVCNVIPYHVITS